VNRRGWLVAAAGGLAGATGLGLAAWQARRHEVAPAVLWSLDLPRSGGGTLAFAALRGQPLLVNFWATWCVPCVVEMPLLQRFHETRARDWQVVGIAVDQAPAVATFVAARGIRFPVVLGDLGTIDLSRTLGNVAGGLPFSVAIGRDGRIIGRRLGAVDEGLLAEWVAAAH
jgi:thiol-disulfide isomerase/thioredoxin